MIAVANVLNILFMVLIRIVFKTHEVQKFVAFTMAEAYSLVDEYDSKKLISIHFYPNYYE